MTQPPKTTKPDDRAPPAGAEDARKADPGSERGHPPRDRDSGAEPAGGSSSSEGTNARHRGAEPGEEHGEHDSGRRAYTPPRS